MGGRTSKKNKKVERIKFTPIPIPLPIVRSRCVVCNYVFDNPAIFPKDFPKEWKLCCNCKKIAGSIVSSGFKETVAIFERVYGWFKLQKVPMDDLEKINKLIRIV